MNAWLLAIAIGLCGGAAVWLILARDLLRVVVGLALAGTAVAVAAGGTAYLIGSYRAEQAALEQATRSARHFATPAMRMIVSSGLSDGHSGLERLLDKNRFVGLQVFDRDGRQVYENWGASAPSVIDALRTQVLQRPEQGQLHRTWLDVRAEHLIHVVVPITDESGHIAGYVRTIAFYQAYCPSLP